MNQNMSSLLIGIVGAAVTLSAYSQTFISPTQCVTVGLLVLMFEIHLEVLATIEDGDEGSDNDDQSHCDPKNYFSYPDLDDILEDIDEERPVEGENANPHSAENTGPGIVIRNNPRFFMTNVDPNAALACKFPIYTNIVPAHLLYDKFGDEELFVGQQFDNKKYCLHVIKQLSLKLGVDYKVTKST
ncbi:hypothetical protein J1N35_000364 [Gossypium stocksii]|uniref:Uncharacterized protein n=1 Tax=Gossypium stocksii TaxID=47602 RepID=A0A9D4AKE9_9ROSI|nr:hypothetical protein J1N35_000364 [Gossypium stocksii]